MIKNFEEFKELPGFILELKEFIGKDICQEIVYIIYDLLELKLERFKTLIYKGDNSFLPKI